MVNNFEIKSGAFGAGEYNDVDGIALFLCKECAEHLAKLNLPTSVLEAVEMYIKTYPDIYASETLNTLTLPVGGRLLHVFIAGCGVGAECKPNEFRKTAGVVARAIRKAKLGNVILAAPIFGNPKRTPYVEATVEGLLMGAYTFTKFKSDAKATKDCVCTLLTAIESADAVISRACVNAEAVSFTRDLVNNPGNEVVPETMAQVALKLAETLPLTVEVLDEAQMQEKKMQAILAVGQGSVHPPRMVVMKYNGAGDAPYVAYVGKGITFDSGGISIKPDDNMGEMKDDMSGAGAVMGAMKAIAERNLPVNVIGVLACAENMPDANAQRPGDIVRAANGKTIEVVSTDAEGRMVLADAVWYACELGATKVLDIATLTGGVIVALGKETSGIIANDDAFAEEIKVAGKFAGESYWHLPSLSECKEAIKSDVADLLNSAGRAASCITGGLFIGEFIKDGVTWAHLDIGGTSTADKDSGHKVKGGTGFGTLTLIKLAEQMR